MIIVRLIQIGEKNLVQSHMTFVKICINKKFINRMKQALNGKFSVRQSYDLSSDNQTYIKTSIKQITVLLVLTKRAITKNTFYWQSYIIIFKEKNFL